MLHKTTKTIDLLNEYKDHQESKSSFDIPLDPNRIYEHLKIYSHQTYNEQDIRNIVQLIVTKNDEQFKQTIPTMAVIDDLEKYCREKSIDSKPSVTLLMDRILSSKHLFWDLLISGNKFPEFRKKHPDLAQKFLQFVLSDQFNKKASTLGSFKLFVSNFPDLKETFYEALTADWKNSIENDNDDDDEDTVKFNRLFWHRDTLLWLLQTYDNHAEDILNYLFSKKTPKYDYGSAKCLYHHFIRAYDFITYAYGCPSLTAPLMDEMQKMLRQNLITWTEWKFIFDALDKDYLVKPALFKSYANSIYEAAVTNHSFFLNIDEFNVADMAHMFKAMPRELAEQLMVKVFDSLHYYDNQTKLSVLSQIVDQFPDYSEHVAKALKEIICNDSGETVKCQQIMQEMKEQNAISAHFDTKLFEWAHFRKEFFSRTASQSNGNLDKELAVVLSKKRPFKIKKSDLGLDETFNPQDLTAMVVHLTPTEKDLLLRKVIIGCCPLDKTADESLLNFFYETGHVGLFFMARIHHKNLYEIAKLFPEYSTVVIERLKEAIDYVTYITKNYRFNLGHYDINFKDGIISTYKMYIELASCINPAASEAKEEIGFAVYRNTFLLQYEELYKEEKRKQSPLFIPHWVNNEDIKNIPAANAMEKIVCEAVRMQNNYLTICAWNKTKEALSNQKKNTLAIR